MPGLFPSPVCLTVIWFLSWSLRPSRAQIWTDEGNTRTRMHAHHAERHHIHIETNLLLRIRHGLCCELFWALLTYLDSKVLLFSDLTLLWKKGGRKHLHFRIKVDTVQFTIKHWNVFTIKILIWEFLFLYEHIILYFYGPLCVEFWLCNFIIFYIWNAIHVFWISKQEFYCWSFFFFFASHSTSWVCLALRNGLFFL